MGALAGPRKIETYGTTKPTYYGGQRGAPVADDAIIYHGAIVGKNSAGYWEPATPSGGHTRFAIADLMQYSDLAPNGQKLAWDGNEYAKIDNTNGGDGARHFLLMAAIVKCKNKAQDEIDETMIGGPAYVEDDQTVRKTGVASEACGMVCGLANDGTNDVWVRFDPLAAMPAAPTGGG